MRLTGRWCARYGAGPVSAAAAVLVCLSTVAPGLAWSVPVLCAALLVFGAATGAVNVAANTLGVQVEARLGRPLLSGLHAGFSLGGLAGALLGGAAAAVLGVGAHLALVAAAGLGVTSGCCAALLATRSRAPAGRHRTVRRSRRPSAGGGGPRRARRRSPGAPPSARVR